MIIDSHNHLFDQFVYMQGCHVNEIIKQMDQLKIDKSIVFTLRGLFQDFRLANDEIAKVAASFQHRLIPFGTFNPWFEDEALDEMDRCVNNLSLKGFKLHPWFTSFPINSKLMDPIASKLNQLGVPVFIHSGTPPWSEPLQIAEFAKKANKITIIMGHMGLPDLWQEAIVAAEQASNILLETSGAHSLAITTAVERLGASRVVFGSDMPFGGRENQLFQLVKIRHLKLKASEEQAILGGNLARVFGFE